MKNLRLKELADEVGINTSDTDALEDFAQALVERVMLKIEDEISLAYEQGENWTAATLEALAIGILDDLDMELPDENN